MRTFQIARLSPWEKVMSAVLGLLVVHAVVVLAVGIGNPLLDLHSFRQTQTALTAYWILQGGPWLAYETPVVGAPWSIPLEFPIYQLLAAGLAKIGLPLDAAGRVVAFGFFLGSLWPLRMLFENMRLGRPAYLATSILFVASPLYLYWSRTFMIESCALFFALLWLALLVRNLESCSIRMTALAAAAGSLAVLAKVTTFPAFAMLGCIVAISVLMRGWSNGDDRGRLVRIAACAAIATAIPFAAGFVWVPFSDGVKTANVFGSLLTSNALSAWNFGSLEQRLSAKLWLDTIYNRVIPDTLGLFSTIAFVALAATLTSLRSWLIAGVLLLAFLVPFLVFTNVHIVHNYYQNANALFLLAAVGFGIGRIFENGRQMLAVFTLSLIAAGQIIVFYEAYAGHLTRDYSQDRLLRISQIAREATQPGQSLIVIGTDWASMVPYLSERKSLVLAPWFPLPLLKQVFADPQSFLGDQKFSGVVYCQDNLPTYKAAIPDIEAFVAGRAQLGEFGGCRLLTP